MKLIISSIILMILSLTSCTIFGPITEPEIQQHSISAMPRVLPKSVKHPVTIRVEQPVISAPYNRTDIIYEVNKNQPKAYSVNEWSAPPGRMIQGLISQTLRKTGYFNAVLFTPDVGSADFILSTKVLVLYMDLTRPRKFLNLVAEVQLLDAKSSVVIGEKSININTPIRNPSPKNAAFAANRATQRLLEALAKFTIETLRNYDAKES